MPSQISSKEWWSARQAQYNYGLLSAGILAFSAYAIILWSFQDRLGSDAEITVFTILLQSFGYLVYIVLANLFYFLGPFAEYLFPVSDTARFRRRLFSLGFWFSCGLPFIVPILLLLQVLVASSRQNML